jgi:photosystem II stability/assembly factor-like uncharacterized protein
MKRLIRCRLTVVIMLTLVVILLGSRAGLATTGIRYPVAQHRHPDPSNQAKAEWVKLSGPLGGMITTLLVSGGHLYAGTYGGSVFISADQGQSWKESSVGLPAIEITSLAADGINLYAGTAGSGVYRSADNGRTWQAVFVGLPLRGYVKSLAVSGTELFACLNPLGDGIYRSTDQGHRWIAVNAWLPVGRENTTALFASGANIFVGANGVFRSSDRGQSWMKTSLPESPVFSFVANNKSLFVGVRDGIYRSIDEGRSWMKADVGLSEINCPTLAVSGSNLFVGTNDGRIYRSANQGRRWTDVSPKLQTKISVTSLAASGTNLFAGTPCGVLRSTNQGKSWTDSNAGLNSTSNYQLIAGDQSLFTLTCNGILRSTDQGQTWREVNGRLRLKDLSNPLIVASGPYLFAMSGGRVFRSTNQGESWSLAKTGFLQGNVTNLSVSGATLFAWTESRRHLYRSENHGETWTEVILPPKARSSDSRARLNKLFVNENSLFLILAEDHGDIVGINVIYRTSDQGKTWELAGKNLGGNEIGPVVVSGTDILIGSGSSICRSTDNGQSWTVVNNNLSVNAFVANGTEIYAGTDGKGVFLSTDRGLNWKEIDTGSANPFVYSLAVSGTNLFAGTKGGIFRSTINHRPR